VNDSDPVSFFQNVTNLGRDMNGTGERKASFPRKRFRKSFAFDELHNDEVTTVRQTAGVEDHRRMRMSELRHRSRLTQETIGDVGVRRELSFDNLYCDRSLKAEVCGKVNSAHATPSNFTLDPESAGDELRDVHIDLLSG
jgi:hypothetical protein